MLSRHLEFLTFRTITSFIFHQPDRNVLLSSASGVSFPLPLPLRAAWDCFSCALTRAAGTFPICFRWLLSCSKGFTAPIKRPKDSLTVQVLSCKTKQYLCNSAANRNKCLWKTASDFEGFCESDPHPSSSPCRVHFSWNKFSFEMNISTAHVLLHLWKAFIGRGFSQ